ncbi:hypothetical protein [Paenibacillus polymyxa]|uniref:hypothetical protein n=1 Tax=Paenibacillus polymyxa TaxID=1406 RepID=UPI0008CFF1F0|nr:hypothetical protein [Paenibacillus polymyxa]SEI76001.1 hypothetical protein SAMN04488600_101604 [Paenibacillus polymyxa]
MIHVFDLAETAKEIVDILAKHNVPGNLVEDVFQMAESMIGEQVVRSTSEDIATRNKTRGS